MSRARGRWIAAVGGLTILAALPLSAQQPPSLAPGQRVRVTAPSAGLDQMVGTVVAVREREIVLRPDSLAPGADTTTSVSLYRIRTLEVSRGMHRHLLPAVGAGAGIGALLFGVWGYSLAQDCNRKFECDLNTTQAGAIGAALGVLFGGVIGGGVAPRRESWATMPLRGQRVGLIVTPSGRVGLAVSLAF